MPSRSCGARPAYRSAPRRAAWGPRRRSFVAWKIRAICLRSDRYRESRPPMATGSPLISSLKTRRSPSPLRDRSAGPRLTSPCHLRKADGPLRVAAVPPRDRGGEVLRSDDEADRHERLGERRRRSEEHTSELQSRFDLVCRLLLEKKKKHNK